MSVCAFALYLRPRSRFSHTDRLSSVKLITLLIIIYYPGFQRFFFLLGGDRIERRSREGESRDDEKKSITYLQNDQLPDGLIAQLVEHCIGITVVKI